MAQVENASEAPRRWPPATRLRLAMHGALFAAAAIWFAVGAPLTIEWIDEGQIIYPIWRSAAGEVPYRDFGHAYWPGLFVVNGLLMRVFGEDLAVVRGGLVVLKAVIALETFRLACTLARPWIAFAVWAVVVAVWGAPLWVFNTPYANHYALACGLAASLVLIGSRRHSALRPVLAGLLAGTAATFKHTTGAFVALAGITFLVSELRPSARLDARLVRAIRRVTLSAAALAVLLYAARSFLGWTTALVVAPVLAALLRLELAAGSGSTHLADLVEFVVGAAAPVLVCVGLAAWLGVLPALVGETLVGLGQHMTWAIAMPEPGAVAVLCVLALAALAIAPAHWGGGRRARSAPAIALGGCGIAWLWKGGVDVGVLHWMPLVTTLLAVAAWAGGAAGTGDGDARGRAVRLAVLFAAFMLLTLHPGADLAHALMTLPAVLPLAAWLGDRLVGPAEASRARKVVGATFVVLFAVEAAGPFVTQLWRVRGAWAQGAPRFVRATGIWQPDARYSEVADLVERLDAMLPAGAPVVVFPNEQMIYFLAGRPSAIEGDEFALYLLATGIVPPAAAPAVLDEEALVSRLDTVRPLVVIDGEGPRLDQLRRALPALARFLDSRCELTVTIGTYGICRLAPATGTPSGVPRVSG